MVTSRPPAALLAVTAALALASCSAAPAAVDRATPPPAASAAPVGAAPSASSASSRAGAAVPVWVPGGNWNASLVGVDAATARTAAAVTQPGSICGVAQDGRQVWAVTDLGVRSDADLVTRLDARTGAEQARGTAGGPVRDLAVTPDAVWLDVGPRVVGLDRTTLRRRTAWALREPLVGLVGSGGLLWGVGRDSDALLGLDPASGKVVRSVPVGVTPAQVDGVVSHGRHLWVSDATGNRVLEVDPAGRQVVRSVVVGPADVRDADGVNVRGLVLARGRVWAYHLAAADRWALSPVGGPGADVPLPALGMCGVRSDGRDLWFGWAADVASDLGIYRADLTTGEVSRVSGLTHDGDLALKVAP